MVKEEETRKGPWTEQEDVQLAFYVNLFGDRRWDFIAKVSGLKRTGKSCRLRWVNYMHPGLIRGKLSPQEQRLVLQLHAKWGNRWSKIARKVPGRTDNDIKNYWRTHMRKQAQDKKKKKKIMSSSSSSHSSISSSSDSPAGAESAPAATSKERDFYDTGGVDVSTGAEQCSMEEIWKDMALPEEDMMIDPGFGCFEGELLEPSLERGFSCTATMSNPIWDDDYNSINTSLWSMDHEFYSEESNMMMIMPPRVIDHH